MIGISSGPGTVTQNGNNFTISLGTLQQSSSAQMPTLVGINNELPYVTQTQVTTDDTLAGSVNTQGASDILLPLGSTFASIAGTGLYPLFSINPNASTLGMHSETVIIHEASNDVYSSTPLPDQIVTITEDVQPACYVRGTLIQTEVGAVPVEDLAIGNHVAVASGEHRPVRWVGRRSYAGRFLAANPKVQPILFRKGSLGEGLPQRNLLVSPEHAMSLDGVLVPARHLTNGTTIYQETTLDRVDYFHVELESHDVIYAQGAPSETFIDDNSRSVFHNAAEFAVMYPDAPHPTGYCARRVENGYELEAIRQRLAAVAQKMKVAASRRFRNRSRRKAAWGYAIERGVIVGGTV